MKRPYTTALLLLGAFALCVSLFTATMLMHFGHMIPGWVALVASVGWAAFVCWWYVP